MLNIITTQEQGDFLLRIESKDGKDYMLFRQVSGEDYTLRSIEAREASFINQAYDYLSAFAKETGDYRLRRETYALLAAMNRWSHALGIRIG